MAIEFTRRSVLQAISLSPLAFMTGCSNGGLIIALDVAEVAATSAIPVITAFTPQLGTVLAGQATAYAKGIANACAQSVTELGSTDPKLTQDTKIAGYFAAVLSLSLPPGTVSEVLAVIGAIGAAVQIILAEIHPPTPAAQAIAPQSPAAQALLSKYQAQVKALGSDKARIADIMARAKGVKP
jgi:hypothetical protein